MRRHMKPAASLGLLLLLMAMPVHAQDGAKPEAPQSQHLTELEDKLLATIKVAETASAKLVTDLEAKASADVICADITPAYDAYNDAFNQFADVLEAVDSDPVLPAAAKPGEREALVGLWDDIEYSIEDLEDLRASTNCPA